MRGSITAVISVSVIAILQTCGAQEIDLSECGESKLGCFRHPAKCEAASCDFLLTWRQDGDRVRFEMSAPAGFSDSYVAFGLSQDARMVTHHILHIVF